MQFEVVYKHDHFLLISFISDAMTNIVKALAA